VPRRKGRLGRITIASMKISSASNNSSIERTYDGLPEPEERCRGDAPKNRRAT
jgi:hypothetical protein